MEGAAQGPAGEIRAARERLAEAGAAPVRLGLWEGVPPDERLQINPRWMTRLPCHSAWRWPLWALGSAAGFDPARGRGA